MSARQYFNPYPSYTPVGRMVDNLHRAAENATNAPPGPTPILDGIAELYHRAVDGITDYLWKAPQPNQTISCDRIGDFVVLARQPGADGAPERYAMMRTSHIPGSDHQNVWVESRPRGIVRFDFSVAADSAPPLTDADHQRFRYQAGDVLDGAFLGRYLNSGTAVPDTAKIFAVGRSRDGSDYYVVDYSKKFDENTRVMMGFSRTALESQPDIRVLPQAAVPSAPRAPAP